MLVFLYKVMGEIMKKNIAFILILCLFFCLSACKKNLGTSSSNVETTSADSSLNESAITNSSSNITSKTSSSVTSYEDIVCKEATGYKTVNLAAGSSRTVLNIRIPNNWSIIKTNTGHKIKSGSTEIGNVSFEANIPSGAQKLFDSDFCSTGIDIAHTIYSLNNEYWRKINFLYKDNNKSENIALTVIYSELDSKSIVELLTEATLSRSSTEPNFNTINLGSRNKILILGNSFVGTSNIGNILSTMCDSSVKVDARSRGNANVATFTGDGYTLDEIRQGSFSVLFMCGFYSSNGVSEFEHIVNACKASGTKVVIFPAHNESSSAIESAKIKYPDVLVVDWKAEIDALIESGIARSHFCMNDSVSHSKPLAGYVGAHMIYRTIYGKVPSSSSNNMYQYGDLYLLGDYVNTATVKIINENEYIRIN